MNLKLHCLQSPLYYVPNNLGNVSAEQGVFTKIIRRWKKYDARLGVVGRFRETFQVLLTNKNVSKEVSLGKINAFSAY